MSGLQRIHSVSHSASNALGAPSTVLLHNLSLELATEAGDVDVWIAQIVAKRVTDHHTNHDRRLTAVRVDLYT